jgi:molecular chaperone DnaK (HSP70)
MPIHIYRDICKWNKIRWYDKKTITQEFSDYLYRSTAAEGVKKLKKVLEYKLSQKILEKIRLGKHELDGRPARIQFDEHDLALSSALTDDEFSRIISVKTNLILSTMDTAVCGSNDEVDKVILTGGSSRVKLIQRRISKLFSEEKMLKDQNFYNSISKGLALYGFYNNIRIV